MGSPALRSTERAALAIAPLVSPDRWDVLVRLRAMRDPTNEEALRAYRRWFCDIALARFEPETLRRPDRFRTRWEERLRALHGFAELARRGAQPSLPPVEVHLDDQGTALWDGGHRVALYLLLGFDALPAGAWRRVRREPLSHTATLWLAERPPSAEVRAFLQWIEGPLPSALRT